MNLALHVLLLAFIAVCCVGVAVNPFMSLMFGAFIEALAAQMVAAPLAWLAWFGALAGFSYGTHEALEQRTLRAVGAFCFAAGALGFLFALGAR